MYSTNYVHTNPQEDLPQTVTTTGSTVDWSKFKQMQEEASKNAQSTQICPNCGYCPHCGRGGYYGRPYYPYNPWITYTYSSVQDPNQFYK